MDVIKQALEVKAKEFAGEKAWTVDLVLQMGVELARAVNDAQGLSGIQKSELVCQTILTLLEHAEKADTKRKEESTEKEMTTIPWEEYKSVVKTVMPTTLRLVISAARGEIGELQKVVVSAVELATGVDIPDWAEGRIGQMLAVCLPVCWPWKKKVAVVDAAVASVAVAAVASVVDAAAVDASVAVVASVDVAVDAAGVLSPVSLPESATQAQSNVEPSPPTESVSQATVPESHEPGPDSTK